jgi:hypothetical protein
VYHVVTKNALFQTLLEGGSPMKNINIWMLIITTIGVLFAGAQFALSVLAYIN